MVYMKFDSSENRGTKENVFLKKTKVVSKIILDTFPFLQPGLLQLFQTKFLLKRKKNPKLMCCPDHISCPQQI